MGLAPGSIRIDLGTGVLDIVREESDTTVILAIVESRDAVGRRTRVLLSPDQAARAGRALLQLSGAGE